MKNKSFPSDLRTLRRIKKFLGFKLLKKTILLNCDHKLIRNNLLPMWSLNKHRHK